MSGHLGRHAPAISFLVISLLLLQYAGHISGEEPLDSLPDLAVTEFTMTPTKDGYQGYLKIKNIGISSSSEVMVQVLGEKAGKNSNRTDVVSFRVNNLSPGSGSDEDFPWEPEEPGTHILRAIVDINGDEKEGNKFNNVMSLMVTLPSLRSVESMEDGIPDPTVFGTYISGIENMVGLEMTYDDVSDPSLIRVYATVPDRFLEYGTMYSGNSFRTMFNAGSLPPGEHTLIINSSYGGHPLSSEEYTVNVVEAPEWFSSLERTQSFYDRELSSYVFKGRMGIPTYRFAPTVQGIGEIEEISLFETENEVFLSGHVLLDRTTTYTAECDMELTIGEERVLVRQTGRSYAPSPDRSVDIRLRGENEMEMDMARSALGRRISMASPYFDTIKIPVPSFRIKGTVKGETLLRTNGSGPFDYEETLMGMDLNGSTVDLIDLVMPGYDFPRVEVEIEVDWNVSATGRTGGEWSKNCTIDLETDTTITDLGLSEGKVESEWDVFHNGVGLDTAMDPQGEIGRLELSVKDGHLTHLIYTDDLGESEVYINNTYKSNPGLEYLWDGRPLVVWTEAGYMEDRHERASSMRMRYMIGDATGDFSGEPMDLFVNGSKDQHPSIASDHSEERAAIAWIRDIDGNISTMDDNEVFTAFLDGSGWSPPLRITDDDFIDRIPDIWFDADGRLHLIWLTGDYSIRYTVWEQSSGWAIPITLDIEGSPRIDHASFVEGHRVDPYLLLVTSSGGDPYRLGIGTIETGAVDLTTITTSDHHISSPSILEGYQGSWNALWHVWDGIGGDLEMSSNADLLLADKWSETLRLTSDEDLEISPLAYRNDAGTYTIGLIPVHHSNGNLSMASTSVFTIQNLSWGADAISLDLDPGIGSSPGTNIRATVLAEYRGMTPSGRARVDLYRILRDRDTGGQTQELWESKMVEFTTLGQTQQVEFTVPVKEYQYGLVAVTKPALTGIPAHSTQVFSSLPALPDLEILTMDVIRTFPEKALASVEVAVKNWGSVSSGPRDLVLRTSRPTAPLLFEGGSFEPLFLRERDAFQDLNSSVIEIPAGGMATMTMNISLFPGMNNIWSVLDGPDWLPASESLDDLVIPSFPELELTVADPGPTRDKSDPIDLNISVRNVGPWSLNTSYLPPEGLEVHGLDEYRPQYTVYSTIVEKIPMLADMTTISDMAPGESIELNWSFSGYGIIGELELGVGISDRTNFTSEGWEEEFVTFKLIITSEPELQLLDISQSKVGVSFDNNIRVQFHNPQDYLIDVVHITLYNGYPRDNVIISEAIVVGLGPKENRDVILHFPLQEGQYILTTTAEASVMSEDGRKMEWLEISNLDVDIRIQQAGIPDIPDDDEVNMDEVTTAGIITISSMMFVLLVASFFYRREPKEEEEEKE